MSPEVRKQLAAASRTEIVSFGNEDRQKLARELHAKLLDRIESSKSTHYGVFYTNSCCLDTEQSKIRTANENNDVQENRETLQQRGIGSDWMWNSLTYVLGFLILAILMKKVIASYD